MTDEAEVHIMTRGSGHLASPLFTRLPTEIRLKIYHETFAGSVTALCLLPSLVESGFWNIHKPSHKFTIGVYVEEAGISYRQFARSTLFLALGKYGSWNYSQSYHQLLLTCRQVYDEALPLYWSETLVRNGEDYHFSRKYFVERVPDLAKNHIRRILGLTTEFATAGSICHFTSS